MAGGYVSPPSSGFDAGRPSVAVAPDALTGLATGQMTQGQYDEWSLGEFSAQLARDHDEYMARNKYGMALESAVNAGFSPLAALENIGSSPSSASGSSAAPKVQNNIGSVLGAVLSGVIGMATKGMALNASAEAAKDMEMIKQNNRLALAAILSRDKEDRLLTSLASKTDLFNEKMAFEEAMLAKKFELRDLASAKDTNRDIFRDLAKEHFRRGHGSRDLDALEETLTSAKMGYAHQENAWDAWRKANKKK